ncbi:two-component system, sensor histidine kinase RegB [Gammaproteobacteria bacterium]
MLSRRYNLAMFNPDAPDALSAAGGQRLYVLRAVLAAGETLVCLIALFAWQLDLPRLALLILLGLYWLAVAIFRARLAFASPLGHGELFGHLALDVASLSGLLYFSGGYTNPFVSLLLLPVIIAATLLHAWQAWAMTGLAAIAYTALMSWHVPLPEPGEDTAINLHLTGMWLNFLLSAGLVVAFVTRLQAALRERENELRETRERALRDEYLFSLGMQAAAAAHEFATPLATLDLELAELEADFAGDPDLMPRFELLRAQAARIKARLSDIANSARQTVGESPPTRPLDDWLRETVEHWQLMRPGIPLRLAHPLPASNTIIPLPATTTLVTLLNNAADKAPVRIELSAERTETDFCLRVRDHGGRAKPAGWGVGLTLAEAALERIGGRIVLTPHHDGMTAVLTWPAARPS